MGFRGRISSHAAVILPAALSLLLLQSCFNDRLKPVAPTWDVDLTFPLASRTYTVADLIAKDPSVLHVGTGSQVSYSTSVTAPRDSVADAITLGPQASTRSLKLGVFDVTPDLCTNALVLSSLPALTTMPIPDTVVAFSDQLFTIDTFVDARFESGTVVLKFDNKLPTPDTILGPVTLSDAHGTIAVFTFPAPSNIIPARGFQFATASLNDGQTINQNVRLSDLRFHIAGHASPVAIPDTLIAASVAFVNLRAHDANFAYIPAQTINNNDTTHVSIADSTKLIEAVMLSGTIHFNFVSSIPLGLTLRYNLTDVQRRSGGAFVPYLDNVHLNSFGSGDKDVSLAGCRIKSLAGTIVDSLQTISSVDLDGTTTPVTLHDTDKVWINYSSSGALEADTAVAVLKPTRIDVHSVVGLNWGDLPKKFSGQVNIAAASLDVNALSTVGFPMDLSLVLSAKDPATGRQAFLPAPPVTLNPNSNTISSTPVSFDQAAVGQFISTFTAFSGKMPDSIRMDGFVIVNPSRFYNPTPAGKGAVSRRSFVSGTVNVDLPLKLSLTGGVYRDTSSVGIQKDDIKQVNSGTMYMEVLNGLPVQLSITAYLLDSAKTRVLYSVPQSGTPVGVAAAGVNATGIVSSPVQSSSAIPLSNAEVQLMAPNKNIGYTISLVTTPGSPAVQFRSTDSVHVRIWSRLTYQVNK